MTDFIIDDSNADQHARDTASLCGCLPRREAYGALPFASTQPVDLIPWEEMPDRIADQERTQSSLYHIWLDSKIGCMNQGKLSYCWAFSSVFALMLEREKEGLPYEHLSPSSVAGPVTNYVNKGWYIEDALKQMIDVGASTVEFVPETTCRAADFKTGWKESASLNKVEMWQDIGNNPQAQISKLLAKDPLVCCFNWWSHAVAEIRVIDAHTNLPANNPLRYKRGLCQQWGPSYGVNGYFELDGQKGIADGSYAILRSKFAA